MIQHKSFKHGWYYFYRVHNQKVDRLTPPFPQLKVYLQGLFSSCPQEYFETEPRSSQLRFGLSNLHLIPILHHEVSQLARIGLQVNASRFQTNHSKVQLLLLEEDPYTLAIEVPLWLMPSELDGYAQLFRTTTPLTGHIDLLRIEDGKIWVWDYKPNARYEKYAATQVYFYAYMLSQRTGIPLENFRCGYFDTSDAFAFNPVDCALPILAQETLIK